MFPHRVATSVVAVAARIGSMMVPRRVVAGVRWQATIAACTVVAGALLLGSLALVLLLQNSLISTLEQGMTARVVQDAHTLVDEGLTALASSETDRGADSILVQVLDGSGTVVYSSEKGRTTAQSTLRPGPGDILVSGRTLLPVPDDLAAPLVVAQGVNVAGQDFVVLAATSQEPKEEAVTTTAVLLLAGIPLLVGLTGFVTWWRVGRAMGSVEAIRSQVERIESANLTQRVPVPPSRDEIAHLATTMNGMLHRLESSHGATRRFVADASHELRSPLATLTAALEVADADPSDATWRELAPILQTEARRMTRLVDDLLLLSKVDNQALVIASDDVDLDDLADLECRRLRQVTRLGVELSASPVRVLGDEHQLERLLRNLVDNAARAATHRVRVSVTRSAGDAVVRVEDDGPGIATADRERVFERFVRVDESRSRHSGGSGLGLSIAREIASAHGGTLTVGRSGLGGAALVVVLPVGAVTGSDHSPAQASTRR